MLACEGDALDSALLRREAARMRDAVEACTHADVLGHGDLKPSNVLRLRRGGITFIDFELAGPNYRTRLRHGPSYFGRQNCGGGVGRLLSCPSSRPTLATARRDAPPTRASWKRSNFEPLTWLERRYSSPSLRLLSGEAR